MALVPGTRLGAYEVVSLIGVGGMGEVYRARDTELDRDVALKILPDSFADDPDRLMRFQREAKTLASLNHPHIAQIYGFAQSDGASVLVMELVEGEDLASRVARGPMLLDEAIAVARQIAEAIEAAHDAGVIHRDLKPANIKVRADGTVKVLDFGLAKATGSAAVQSAAGPTFTSPAMLTMQGVILGTAAYMSPEQARGRPIDRRSDIWAFGVVLYEMLTGRTLFAMDTVSDTIAAVLTRDVAVEALPAHTPPAVRRVLQRCLQKDPARRFHHIADARLELEQAGAEPTYADGTRSATFRARWWPILATGTASAALAAAIVWLILARPPVAPRRYSFTIPNAGFSTVSYSAISPDGKWIAYSPNVHAGPFRLFLRSLEGFDGREIASAMNTGFSPFFSADSSWLAYFSGTTLYRVPVPGGAAERFGSAPEKLGSVLPATFEGAWADDGTIIVAAHVPIDNVRRRALTRLGPAGVFEYVTKPGPAEAHHDPNVLPGSKTVLFTVNTPKSAVIAAVPLTGGAPQIILSDARRPRYMSAGHLVFQRATSGDLMSVAFDPDRLQVSGDPVRIAAAATVVDSVGFDVSREGTIIYSAPDDTTSAAGFTTVMVDRTGKDATVVTEMGSWAEPRISPDGRTLILRDVVSPNCNLWAIDLQRGARTRVTLEGDNHNPVWRSDGQLTWSALGDARSMRMAQIDRPSHVTALPPSPNERMPESWSRDGEHLAFTEIHPQTGRDILILSVKSGAIRPFANSNFAEQDARFSPDGRWLAYSADESGRGEVYMAPVDADGGRMQISVNGGHSPLWSPDGRELFYVEGAALMTVAVDLRAAKPDVSRPRKLLEGRYVWERNGNFDITPDGKRFVFVRRTEDSDPPATLRVLLNWLRPQ